MKRRHLEFFKPFTAAVEAEAVPTMLLLTVESAELDDEDATFRLKNGRTNGP